MIARNLSEGRSRQEVPSVTLNGMFLAPFLFFYLILFIGLLVFWMFFVWVGVIGNVFQALGLSPHLAFAALLASLLGSYVNIPLGKVESGSPEVPEVVSHFGMRYRVPMRHYSGNTTIAVNVGGAIVPSIVAIYALSHFPGLIVVSSIGTLIVALVVNRFARPIRGMGIATPILVPPIIAALCGWMLGGSHADVVAYASGVFGTLLGADIMNLSKIRGLGAPVASIGGAGTFDGIFLTGIVAVLLA
jgi:uncharacterized membrane protein